MPDGAVADGDGAGLGEDHAGLPDDHGADKHHGAVGQLGTGWLHIRAIWLHLVERVRLTTDAPAPEVSINTIYFRLSSIKNISKKFCCMVVHTSPSANSKFKNKLSIQLRKTKMLSIYLAEMQKKPG